MSLEISDFIILIGLTTIVTTASTTVIIYKIKDDLSKEICAKITKLHERINEIAVRIGIVESQHDNC